MLVTNTFICLNQKQRTIYCNLSHASSLRARNASRTGEFYQTWCTENIRQINPSQKYCYEYIIHNYICINIPYIASIVHLDDNIQLQ